MYLITSEVQLMSYWLSDTEPDVKPEDTDVGSPTLCEDITTQGESYTSSIIRPGSTEKS
jgi:hypothetical protein